MLLHYCWQKVNEKFERNFSKKGRISSEGSSNDFIPNQALQGSTLTPVFHSIQPRLASRGESKLGQLSRVKWPFDCVWIPLQKLDNHCCLKKAPVAQRLLWILALGRIREFGFRKNHAFPSFKEIYYKNKYGCAPNGT